MLPVAIRNSRWPTSPSYGQGCHVVVTKLIYASHVRRRVLYVDIAKLKIQDGRPHVRV